MNVEQLLRVLQHRSIKQEQLYQQQKKEPSLCCSFGVGRHRELALYFKHLKEEVEQAMALANESVE